jgi:ADP-ribose pyrophosphatase
MSDPDPEGHLLENLGDVGRIARQPIYSGRIVELSLDTVRFPDGSTGDLEIVTHAGASAVLPFLDPPRAPDPRLILIHQYRYAAGGPLYEVPAGMPDSPGESWESCARRELSEETGFRASEMRYLGSILTTPGFTDERIHLFAATGLEPAQARPDGDEFLKVIEMRLSVALEKIRSGEIVDAKSIAILLFAVQFLDRVWREDRRPPSR